MGPTAGVVIMAKAKGRPRRGLTAADLAWIHSKREAGARPVRDRGTPETRARLRPDPLRLALTRNVLTQEQHDAMLDIRAAVEIITSDVAVRVADHSREVRTTGRDFEPWRSQLLQELYNDWVDEMARRSMALFRETGAKRWQVGPVLDYAVDDMTLGEVEKARGWKRGSAVEAMRDAADVYIAIKRRHAKSRCAA